MTSAPDALIILHFAIATLLPVVTAALVTYLRRTTRLSELGYWPHQIFCGLLFGAIAISGTELGIVTHDATMNVRDAAPIIAGLYLGGPAGIIAGIIGGVERWFAALWGRGIFTRMACSIATIAAGFYAAALRHNLFEDKRPAPPIAFAIGVVVEVLHLLLVFVTNFDDVARAFVVVQACNFPMIGCNALSVALASVAVSIVSGDGLVHRENPPDINGVIRSRMLGVATSIFIATVAFVFSLMASFSVTGAKENMLLGLREARGNLEDVVSAGVEGSEDAIRATVANNYVGNQGFLVVLTKEGDLVASHKEAAITNEDAQQIYKSMTGIKESELFSLMMHDEFYLAVYQNIDDFKTVAMVPASEAAQSRDIIVLVTSYMEVIMFAALFVANYLLIKRVVVESIWRVNDRLEEITKGNLNVTVDVRDSAEFALLSDGINGTVGALRDAIAAESARIEHDLVTAKTIQESSLPRTFPPFPDVMAFDIYASMNAAREVGGDFYDFFMTDDHTLGFLVADVSGKGIPASLFMMEAKAELANYMKSDMELCEAVRNANWDLCQGNDADMFVTVWAGKLNYHTGELTYVNAGHNYPLLRHDGTWSWLDKRCGLILGTFETAKYRQEVIKLEPGDEILLYTDGVNEAFNVEGEPYGNKRLEEFVAGHTGLNPRMLVGVLRADVRRWAAGAEQSDDITILCLEYGVAPEATGVITVPATIKGLEELRRRIISTVSQLNCPKETQEALDHVVEDLLSSMVDYGYSETGDVGKVQFSYMYDPIEHSISMSFTDWGDSVDPINQGGGLGVSPDEDRPGIAMTVSLDEVDDIAYVRDGDRNVVAIKKSW